MSATVLMRAQEFERSLDALSEAHGLLEPAGDAWLLALHDWIVAENLSCWGGSLTRSRPPARVSSASTP